MSRKVMVTCAVTGGSSAILAKHPNIPKTPAQIAEAALEAAKAGAAIVHIHVREPETGVPSNRFELYEQVVKKLRDAATDVIVNLTCGMDGSLTLASLDPINIGKATTLKNPIERCIHAIKLQPELATLAGR
ncbi:uncharacterized protein (DUF849 family) [Bradyrhizobium sp. USDA 4538]|uniref:3-keto-5-aminohexanoate cleavage protein n=1 Tax=unclassified Bradyrhizobium TaxID=2631580 RepID=UPI00209F37CC|nr:MULTISPECIES: 3-keto-5-aminohexanoate cleavage protein [unclassified Bradyrhizobium]MCP1838678.1 uncharacterized protein (DUF849 family) [Bradyrhizobium sp. USDA 4538]MCP1899244.1 uncharacterized protein (DUF849 family) [Bradyrhizobium sp. USDA 4537]MCP1986644.1 uncharacterized protein (DUF849 family) [Bradyrhizobium sp. USDA 4539]